MFIRTLREHRESMMSHCHFDHDGEFNHLSSGCLWSRAMGRGRDLNPAVLAHIAARVAEGWKVARLQRELPFVKRGARCGSGSVHPGERQGRAHFGLRARRACLALRRQRDA